MFLKKKKKKNEKSYSKTQVDETLACTVKLFYAHSI